MNTLRDLQETLGRHADGLEDHQRHVRPVAVRERVRAARRRRAAAAAATAAVVAVAGVAALATVQGPRQLDPAGPDVVGVDVPDRVTLAGFPYELSGGDPLAGEDDRLRLQESDHPQAVSLVAHGLGSGGLATLYADGEAVARVRGAEQVAAPVPVGGTELLRVRLHGTAEGARVGVAIYGGTGELAPGVGNGVAVFRERVSGAELLTADFSQGTPEVGVRFRGPLDQVRLSEYCRADRDGLWVHVSVDGDPVVGGDCSSGQTDPGTSWYALDVPRAGDHTVRVHVTEGEDGPVVTDPDVVVGIGVYDAPEPVRRLLGTDVFPVVEHGGRTWTLDRVVDDRHLTLDTSEGDRLLAVVVAGDQLHVSWRGALGEGRSARLSSAGVRDPAMLTSGVLLAGDRYDVRLQSSSPPVRGALLVYRPM